MAGEYQTIGAEGRGEYTEKKSRFLGRAVPVSSEEEVQACIEAVRKQYYDARHHCYAYVIGENREKTRAADDGEPSGTAGMPILRVIEGAGLTNILIIVTRYFGGTLLGTGGLVRSYTNAAARALEDAPRVRMCLCTRLSIGISYSRLDRVLYFLQQEGIEPDSADYTDKVTLTITAESFRIGQIREKLVSLTGADILLEELGEDFYPLRI